MAVRTPKPNPGSSGKNRSRSADPADRRPLAILWLVGLAATVIKLAIIWRGLPEKTLICDDAYYYFTIARNIGQGLGPTFDGLSITNGFHPLWQLVLVPVFRLFPGDIWSPVRLALSLTAALDLLSGRLIFGLVVREGIRAREGARGAALAAAILWFVLPPTFLLGLRGMESSLSTALLLLLAVNLGRYQAPQGWVSYRTALATGALLALCGWARTDNLPVGGLGVAAVLLAAPAQVRLRRRILWLAACAVAAAAVMAPWFAWSYAHFGSIVQVSGQVKLHAKELFGNLPWGWDTPLRAAITVLNMLFAPLYVSGTFLSGEEFEGGRLALPLFLVFLGSLAGVTASGLAADRRWVRLRRATPVFACVFVAAHSVLYGFIWRAYATWYAHSFFAFLIITGAVFMAPIGTRSLLRRRGTFAVLGLGIAAQLVYFPLFAYRLSHLARGPELQFGPVLERMTAQSPGPLTLGAFDAGQVGYIALKYPKITVINLDGLVNNEAFAAAREGRYTEYVTSHVTIVIQDLRRAGMYVPAEEVAALRRRYGQE